MATHDKYGAVWRRVAESLPTAALAFIVLGVAITAAGEHLGTLDHDAPKLDFMWLAPAATYHEVLLRYGEAGRHFYFWMNTLDMLFPLSVAWFGRLLLRRAFPSLQWLAVWPQAFAVLDWIENVLIFGLLGSWPRFSPALAGICAPVTALKLLLLGLSYLLMATALARLGTRRWRSRHG